MTTSVETEGEAEADGEAEAEAETAAEAPATRAADRAATEKRMVNEECGMWGSVEEECKALAKQKRSGKECNRLRKPGVRARECGWEEENGARRMVYRVHGRVQVPGTSGVGEKGGPGVAFSGK